MRCRTAARGAAPPAASASFTASGDASRTTSHVSERSGANPARASASRVRGSSSGAQRIRTTGSIFLGTRALLTLARSLRKRRAL